MRSAVRVLSTGTYAQTDHICCRRYCAPDKSLNIQLRETLNAGQSFASQTSTYLIIAHFLRLSIGLSKFLQKIFSLPRCSVCSAQNIEAKNIFTVYATLHLLFVVWSFT